MVSRRVPSAVLTKRCTLSDPLWTQLENLLTVPVQKGIKKNRPSGTAETGLASKITPRSICQKIRRALSLRQGKAMVCKAQTRTIRDRRQGLQRSGSADGAAVEKKQKRRHSLRTKNNQSFDHNWACTKR